jgi:hypothetical protein
LRPNYDVALLNGLLESIARIKATLFWDGANAGKQQTEFSHPKQENEELLSKIIKRPTNIRKHKPVYSLWDDFTVTVRQLFIA